MKRVLEVQDRLLTIKEVAEFTRLSIGGLYHKIKSNEIPVTRLGRAIRFRISDLLRWFDDSTEYPRDWKNGGDNAAPVTTFDGPLKFRKEKENGRRRT